VEDHFERPVAKVGVGISSLRVERQDQADVTNLGGILDAERRRRRRPLHALSPSRSAKIFQRQNVGRDFSLGRFHVVAPGRIAGHERVRDSQVHLPELAIPGQGDPDGGSSVGNRYGAVLGGPHRDETAPVRAQDSREYQLAGGVGGQFRRRFASHDDVVDAEPGGGDWSMIIGGTGTSTRLSTRFCARFAATIAGAVTTAAGGDSDSDRDCVCVARNNKPRRAPDSVCRVDRFGPAGLPVVPNKIDSFGHGPTEGGDANCDCGDSQSSSHARVGTVLLSVRYGIVVL